MRAFALIQCSLCGRGRIVSLSDSASTCPWCGYEERNGRARIVMESDDQAELRAALARATGVDGMVPTAEEVRERRRRIAEADPESTLAYRYEHAADLDERMEVLAEGLTELRGEFTLEDVREFEPRRAERMLEAMLARGFVHETGHGRYRARPRFDGGMSLRFLPSILSTSRMMPGSLLCMM